MDYQKLDAALIAALDNANREGGTRASEELMRGDVLAGPGKATPSGDVEPRTFPVFIHTTHPLHAAEADYLASLGVRGIGGGPARRRRIFTATLPAPAIEALSEAVWVRALRLSQALSLTPSSTPTSAPPSGPNRPAPSPDTSIRLT